MMNLRSTSRNCQIWMNMTSTTFACHQSGNQQNCRTFAGTYLISAILLSFDLSGALAPVPDCFDFCPFLEIWVLIQTQEMNLPISVTNLPIGVGMIRLFIQLGSWFTVNSEITTNNRTYIDIRGLGNSSNCICMSSRLSFPVYFAQVFFFLLDLFPDGFPMA